MEHDKTLRVTVHERNFKPRSEKQNSDTYSRDNRSRRGDRRGDRNGDRNRGDRKGGRGKPRDRGDGEAPDKLEKKKTYVDK